MSDTIYVRNEEGGIHSVDQEHYDKYLTFSTSVGNTYITPGWEIISEADAKKDHPQLFGEPDPQVFLSTDELVKAAQRKKLLDEVYADQKAEAAAAEQEAAAAAEEAKTPASKTK